MRKIDLTNFKVANSETARQINRRIALNFIRRQQPMSRADLARCSGLQRSTVSAIIDQLIEEGWVTEGAIGRAPRGRRPRFLHLNVERAGILAVELRPAICRVALAGIDARFLMQTSWPTPRDPDEFISQLARTVAGFLEAHPRIRCEGMGISVPGRVNACGRLVFAPNLGWGEVDLKESIEKVTGIPVVLENAGNACALAELWFGGHPEHVRNLVALTISEGIGVGLLLNGQLVHGANGMAGEFGHVVINPKGPLCSCGRRGCWERYASNEAAVQYYLGKESSDPVPSVLAENPGRMRFDDLLRFACQGDKRAIEALERMGHFLGKGIGGLITGLAPEVIVIIGQVTAAWNLVGPIVDKTVAAYALPQVSTRIVTTDPGTQPRLRGAVTLVVQQHFSAPTVA